MVSKSAARAFLALVLWALPGCKASESTAPAGTSLFCGGICATGFVNVQATFSTAGLRFALATPEGRYPALIFYAALPGTALQAVTYDEGGGAAATTAVLEAATGGTVWTQATAAEANVGSFVLSVTDAGASESTDGGTRWPAPQGCLLASLQPQGQLTDAGVVVSVIFPGNTTTYVSCPNCTVATCPALP